MKDVLKIIAAIVAIVIAWKILKFAFGLMIGLIVIGLVVFGVVKLVEAAGGPKLLK